METLKLMQNIRIFEIVGNKKKPNIEKNIILNGIK